MTHPTIHCATANDATQTAELIADAFFTLDATEWLIPGRWRTRPGAASRLRDLR